MEYDWWVPHSLANEPNGTSNMIGGFRTASLATYPPRMWNMIGGFPSASHLTIETWNMIGRFRGVSHLTADTWHMICRGPLIPFWMTDMIARFHPATHLTNRTWNMIGGFFSYFLSSCLTICFIMRTQQNVNLCQMASGAELLHIWFSPSRCRPDPDYNRRWGWSKPLFVADMVLTWSGLHQEVEDDLSRSCYWHGADLIWITSRDRGWSNPLWLTWCWPHLDNFERWRMI
jgi:hypothetical protein